MRNLRVVAMGALVIFGSVLLYASGAQAATASFPEKAPQYTVWFVRAFDECTSGVTIVNPGSVQACPQTNATTDATNTMTFAKLKVSKSGRTDTQLKIVGKGFSPTAQIGLQLTLRVSNSLTASPAPATKTYQDETIVCGPVTGGTCGRYFQPISNGKINAKDLLNACLAGNNLSGNLGSGNMEVVDAALIDCTTGKAIGVPGVLRQ